MSDPKKLTDEGVRFLDGVFQRLDLDVRALADAPRDDELVMRVEGADLEVLERRADLLTALTQLTGQAVAKAAGERVRCVIDVGGAFDARKALLETVASDAARAVVKSGRRAVLDGLSSTERRVVHNVLAEQAGVRTRSEGDEASRLLLIERA